MEVNIENTIMKKACDKTINGLDHQHCLQQKIRLKFGESREKK